MSDVGRSRGRGKWFAWAALIVIALVSVVSLAEVRWTRPVRRAVGTYYRLMAAASRGDLEAARSLCTGRFLATQPLKLAPEGGIVGLPRGIDPNFRAWREGDEVRLCPSDRVGPLYRFVPEGTEYRFDGLVGLLRSDGRIDEVPATAVSH